MVVCGLAAALILVALTGRAGAGSPAPAQPLAESGDWPMYGHDPSRTNFNPAETAINQGNVSQLGPVWQANLNNGAAIPFGGPSVANGRVYVTGGASQGDNLFAFDAVTGIRAWSADAGHGSEVCFGVGMGTVPAIAGTTIVLGGGDAAYYGYRDDGTRLWRHALNVGPSGFPWTSPLIANNRAYVGIAADCDNPSVRGELRALDLASGHLLANQYFVGPGEQGGGIWNSATLSPDGSTLVVATGEDYICTLCTYTRSLVSLDPFNLAIFQHDQQGLPHADADYATTPIIFQDRYERTLVGAVHKNGYFYAYVLDNLSAGPLWSRHTGASIGSMAAYEPSFGDGGTLFIIGEGLIFAVDPATGMDRWPPVAGYTAANMAVANGLLFLNGSGTVDILDETTGTALRTLTPANAGPTNSGVVVAHGFVYWVSGSYLNAWSLPGCRTPFGDLPGTDPFYSYIRCLYCQGIVSGYNDGTFRAGAAVTRGQAAKIVANAAGYDEAIPSSRQTFTDVPPSDAFWLYVERATLHGVIAGYTASPPCTTGVPCFLPSTNLTRGQLAKIAANAAGYQDPIPSNRQTFADVPFADPFWIYIERAASHSIISGYSCGGPGEPCDTQHRPYFRAGAAVTRGQTSKIVANTFFPNCAPAAGPQR